MTIVTNKNRKTGEDSKYVYCEIEVEGKCIDMDQDTSERTGVPGAFLKQYPCSGYGSPTRTWFFLSLRDN